MNNLNIKIVILYKYKNNMYIKYYIFKIIIIIMKDCEKRDKYLDLARELKNYGT